MIKRIAFFTVGFAFNRLVRMKFYEKIFPKNVEIYLFTTNKYLGKEKENYQQRYEKDLKRTKVIYADYNPLKLSFTLRKLCKKHQIDRVMTLGHNLGGFFLLFATLLLKTDFCMNVLAAEFNRYKITGSIKESALLLADNIYLFVLMQFAKKGMFTDALDAKRAPTFFLREKNSMNHLPAPVNTDLFKIKNKVKCRKKLKLPLNKKIIIFVGRIVFTKGSNYLKELIKKHKDIHFIVIGRMIDKDFLNMKCKNFQWIEKKTSKELIDYYNAADLSFCVNREGGGIGLTSEEALACGAPIIVSKLFRLKKSPALYQVSLNFEEIDKAVIDFFKLSKDERKKVSKISRNYAKETYSDKVLKNKYITAYLIK
ncbi:putative glycosyl transferase [archaeon BMS3Abin17]|nr:putative glycosyl transferase [archaeon BMS3Abin17]HDZ61226.1 glycosyltransferase [Candidatus Pacearchaeota archaeon]